MCNTPDVPFDGYPMVTDPGSSLPRPAQLGDKEFRSFLVGEKGRMLAEWPIEDIFTDACLYIGRVAQIEPNVTAVSDAWSGLGWRGQLLQASVARHPRGSLLTGMSSAIQATRATLLKERDLAAIVEGVECMKEEASLAGKQLGYQALSEEIGLNADMNGVRIHTPSYYDLLIRTVVTDIAECQTFMRTKFRAFVGSSVIDRISCYLSACQEIRMTLLPEDCLDHFETDEAFTHIAETTDFLAGHEILASRFESRTAGIYDQTGYPLHQDADDLMERANKTRQIVLGSLRETKQSFVNHMSTLYFA